MKKVFLTLALVMASTSMMNASSSKKTLVVRDCGQFASSVMEVMERDHGCLDTLEYNFYWSMANDFCENR